MKSDGNILSRVEIIDVDVLGIEGVVNWGGVSHWENSNLVHWSNHLVSHWSVNHWSGNLVNHWSGHFVNLISWDVDLIFWALLIKVLDVVTKWFDLTVHCFKGLEHSEEVSSAYVISEMVSDVPTFIESVTSTAWEVSKGLLIMFAVIHKTIIG